MKYALWIFFITCYIFALKPDANINAKATEEKDIGCITLLILAGDKSKKNGEMKKYEKLDKLKKNIQEKYKGKQFSDDILQSQLDEHSLKIKEKGQRYINKNLQKCGLK
tara:strand:+ start:613 stop:939 length:327 start_codon:yes stop_codon:yes gene_type:complete